jgi:hypothetical protein
MKSMFSPLIGSRAFGEGTTSRDNSYTTQPVRVETHPWGLR